MPSQSPRLEPYVCAVLPLLLLLTALGRVLSDPGSFSFRAIAFLMHWGSAGLRIPLPQLLVDRVSATCICRVRWTWPAGWRQVQVH